MQSRLPRLSLLLFYLLVTGCGSTPSLKLPPSDSKSGGVSSTNTGEVSSAEEWFQDITASSGVKFRHDPGIPSYFMPQIMGSGVGLLDYDDDGRLDLYLIHNAGPQSKSTNCLYHQEPDGTFRDVSKGSGLDVSGYGMGVATGDVNNDGKVDILLTEYNRTRLFLNHGAGKFEDISEASGLKNGVWGVSAGFLDADGDGWLDLFIANYVDYDPSWDCRNPAGQKDYCAPATFPGTATQSQAHYHLAVVLFSQVDPDKQSLSDADRELLEKTIGSANDCLKLRPEHGLARLFLGQAYQRLGRIDEALAAYQFVKQIRPDIPQTYALLTMAFLDRGAREAALLELETAKQRLRADDPLLQETLKRVQEFKPK